METNKNVFEIQKYFIFKLSDILNNAFHSFEEKRMESLLFCIELCLDTYEEMHNSPIGEDKLEKSYRGLLNSLLFQLKKHPFQKLPVYKTDFERLFQLINDRDKEKDIIRNPYELYTGLKSLQKKLKKMDFNKQYVECLQNGLRFKEVDVLIEALVSDLLYMGYSLKYLSEWYSELKDEQFFKVMTKGDISAYVEKLNELNGKKNEYEIVIAYHVKSESHKEAAKQLLEKHFSIMTIEEAQRKFSVSSWCWKNETYACKKYITVDHYKAIEMAKKEFLTEKELFAISQNDTDVIRDNKIIGYMEKDHFKTVDGRVVDNTKLINYFDKNRVEQLNRFIELKDNMNNEDVDTLERILRTLHTAKTYNIQNRFLNFWSALEYAIYPFPKKAIIEKARTLASESLSLFYIKNKMNIFWERLSHTLEKKEKNEYPKCKTFLQECGDEKDFNTSQMIAFLQTKDKYQEMLEEISFNIVLKREMMELIMLVTEPEKTKDAIQEYHDSVVHDLDCIYRLRNQLIHSAKIKEDSLEHISLRLYRYVNSIVSTILYYKEKNSEVSIDEILNSMHNTYEVYLDTIEQSIKKAMSVEVGYKLVRPKYLFLE